MTTAALAVLLLAALGAVTILWRSARLQVADLKELLDATCAEVDTYRAELDALTIGGPPPAACAALTPDDPSLLPAEVEQWLRTHTREH